MNEHVFDSSCTLPTRPKWHWIIVAYFHDASKMYRTRHLNRLLYFNVILHASCKFSTRRNDIYDPSARIINNLLNSTIFWTRHINSATRPLNSATRQILHWNIVAYFGEASSQLSDASAQLRDASKMQLWPQWLTIWFVSFKFWSFRFKPFKNYRWHFKPSKMSKCEVSKTHNWGANKKTLHINALNSSLFQIRS